METGDKLLDTVRLLYTAAEQVEAWPDAVARCMALTESHMGFLWAGRTGEPFQLAVLRGLDPSVLDTYQAYYAGLDVQLQSAMRHPAATVLTGPELNGGAKFYDSEFFVDFYGGQLGFRHCLATPLINAEGFTAGLGLHRSSDGKPFGEDEITCIRPLIPHLQQSLRLYSHMRRLERADLARRAALDRLQVGFVFVDVAGHVIDLNRAALDMLNSRDGVAVENRRLVANRPQETGILRRLIAEAARTSLHQGASAGGALALPRPSGKPPLAVAVMPLNVGQVPLRERPTVLVLLADPETRPQLPEAILARLYGLTQAEARLAAALATGSGLTEYAERAGITHHTARQHLKRVLAKTDTHRQSDLVRLLLSGPAGMALGTRTG